MVTNITARGEEEVTTKEVKPQVERIEFIKPPGAFTETIKIAGTVPDGKYFHIKTIIQIRDASPIEIQNYLAQQQPPE